MREMDESGSVNGSWGQAPMFKMDEVNYRDCVTFSDYKCFPLITPAREGTNVSMN